MKQDRRSAFKKVTMKFLQAFGYAARGILMFFRSERNGSIQLIVAVVTATAGGLLRISGTDWIHVVLCIGAVFAAEMMNTAIEKICDVVQPDPDPRIRDIKDIAAGAVLLIALTSAVIGAIIFTPYLFK
jgi:diacylglycerol kinase